MLANEYGSFVGQQIGNYEVKALLIERAVSNLYLAQDVNTDRRVFLEILHPFIENNSSLAIQFQQRGETLAQFEHANIASVQEAGALENNLVYTAVEYVPGVSLGQKLASLAEGEAFSVVEALRFARQIADALAVAHAAGIVHHDLRPENIIVSDGGRPVLIDLSVPVVANVSTPPRSGEQSEVLDYTPPERQRGKKLTAQGNIYSLGIILYELLAGHRPKLASSPWDIFENTTPAREITLEAAREGLHPETYQLVRDCLRRQEWARHETMAEVVAAIDEAIAAEQSTTSERVVAVPAVGRQLWRYAAIGVIGLALLFFLLWRGSRNDTQADRGQRETALPERTMIVLADLPVVLTETTTPAATLSPTPPATPTTMLEAPVELLAPADGSEVNNGDDITFGWSYVPSLKAEQQFVIYLFSNDSEAARLGIVAEPVVDTHYRLVVEGDELDVSAGVYEWQIVLEEGATGSVLAASNPRTITIVVPTPTATRTPTPAATATLTPTRCVVSPWPTWVRYTIQFGDTLSSLAIERGTLVEEIQRVNCLEDNVLTIGRVLWLPPLPATETPLPTNTQPPPPPPSGTQPPPPPSETQPAPATAGPPTPTVPPP